MLMLCIAKMSGSCHLGRASNVEIDVECQIFVIVIFFNCHRVIEFYVSWKNQNKHSTLNLSLEALSKWHELDSKVRYYQPQDLNTMTLPAGWTYLWVWCWKGQNKKLMVQKSNSFITNCSHNFGIFIPGFEKIRSTTCTLTWSSAVKPDPIIGLTWLPWPDFWGFGVGSSGSKSGQIGSDWSKFVFKPNFYLINLNEPNLWVRLGPLGPNVGSNWVRLAPRVKNRIKMGCLGHYLGYTNLKDLFWKPVMTT